MELTHSSSSIKKVNNTNNTNNNDREEEGGDGDLENLDTTINHDHVYIHDKMEEDEDQEKVIKNILHYHHRSPSSSSPSPFPTQSSSSPSPSHSHPPPALSMDSFLLHSQLWTPHPSHSLTLRHALGKDGDPHLLYFMKFLGFVCHDEHDPPLMQFFWMTWFLLSKVFLISYFIYLIYLWILYNLRLTSEESLVDKILFNYLYFVLVTQTTILFPALYFIHERLNHLTHSMEVNAFSTDIRISWQYFLFIIVITLLYLIFSGANHCHSPLDASTSQGDHAYYPLFALGQFASCCVLSSSLVVYSGDASVAKMLVDTAFLHHENQTLSLEMINAIRKEFQRRSARFHHIFSALVCSALLSVTTCLIRLYVSDANACGVVATLAIYSKEIPFAIIMLYHAGKINDLVDELVEKISLFPWDESKELKRIALAINLTARPLSLSLVGVRIKTRTLLYNTIGLVFSICIGLIKSFMTMAL